MKRHLIKLLAGLSLVGASASLMAVVQPVVVKADSVADIERFWNSYIAAINDSIEAGSDKTEQLWAVAQPRHIQEMMADYISAGQRQSPGNRTYKIIAEDSQTVTFTVNDSRTVVLQKQGDSFKIQSFDW